MHALQNPIWLTNSRAKRVYTGIILKKYLLAEQIKIISQVKTI